MATDTQPLPALFQRPGIDRMILDRNPEIAELLDASKFFDAIEDAMKGYDAAAEKAAGINSDGDLTPEARGRRVQPLLEAAERSASEEIDGELAKIESSLQRARADIDGSSRPPAPASIESIAHEIRVAECRRELATIPAGARVQIPLAAAQAGDVVPILAAERSYLQLVPPEVVAQARVVVGEALNKPAAEAVRVGTQKLEIGRRYAAQAKALMQQKGRGLTTPSVS